MNEIPGFLLLRSRSSLLLEYDMRSFSLSKSCMAYYFFFNEKNCSGKETREIFRLLLEEVYCRFCFLFLLGIVLLVGEVDTKCFVSLY